MPQPRLTHAQVPKDRLDRDAQHFRAFVDCEAGKKTQLDGARFSRIEFTEPFQGIIQVEKHGRIGDARVRHLLQHHVLDRHVRDSGAASGGIPGPGVIHQNLAHQLSRNAEKVSPVFVVRLVLTHQPQVGLVYQSSRLKGVVRPLAGKIAFGDASQFLVRRRKQPVDGAPVSVPDLMKQLRQRGRRVHIHADSNKCFTRLYDFNQMGVGMRFCAHRDAFLTPSLGAAR